MMSSETSMIGKFKLDVIISFESTGVKATNGEE